VDSGAPEGYAIPAPTVTPVLLSYYCQTTRISSEMKIVLEISTNDQNAETYVIPTIQSITYLFSDFFSIV
jgi:hypothetical protein